MNPADGLVNGFAYGLAGGLALLVLVLLTRAAWRALQRWAQQSGESTLEPEERPGDDDQFARWRDDEHLRGCSCSGHRVTVIHDHGTYCGDQQWEQIEQAATDAVERSGWDEATAPAAIAVAVEGVMAYLMGDRRSA